MRFADHLRSWSPEALSELLAARTDLIAASEDGFESLARRATSARSLGACLVRSDVGMLIVIDALMIAAPATADEIDDLLGTGDVDAVLDALVRLQRRGVVTVTDGVASPVGDLGDLLHGPLGLGPSIVELWDGLPPEAADEMVRLLGVDGASRPSTTARAVASRMAQADGLDRLLADAPEGTVEVLEALVEQRAPAIGLPAGHLYRDIDDYDPLSWMLGHGLLVAANDSIAELPREVVIARSPQGLAPDAVIREIAPHPVPGLGPDAVAAAAADRAGRTLEATEAILRLADDGEIAMRKSGGVGVREVRRIGKLIDLDPRDVGRLIELLAEVELVLPASGALGATRLAVRWWNLPRVQRWLVLVRGWMTGQVFLSRALYRDEDGTQHPALGDVHPIAVAEAGRHNLLDLVRSLDDGFAYDPEQLTEAVVWRAPNLWGMSEPYPEVLVEWTLAEATLLGLVAMDAPTAAVAALVDGSSDAIEAYAVSVLGQDQRQVVLQSDLTAVALGPLDPSVAGPLGDLADRVSGLSVPTYRFSEGSLRRGFDRGWTADTMGRFLGEHALSGLPQPLEYLIDDVARRYGTVRVLPAQAIVVTDDEATAVEIASTTRAAKLGLRLVAPTVLIAPVEPHRMVEELRAEGLFPVLDGPTIGLGPTEPTRGPDAAPSEGFEPGSSAASGPDTELGLPADWSGPVLSELALPGEVADAVERLIAADGAVADPSGSAGDGDDLARRLERLWNRHALVHHLKDGELVETRGILVGIRDTLTLLDDRGIEEVPIEAVISVEDPTR